MQRFLNRLVPFILIGVALVVFAFGIMLLAYILMIGAIIGFVLFLFSLVRAKFFTPKSKSTSMTNSKENKPGRIIDSDDWKEL